MVIESQWLNIGQTNSHVAIFINYLRKLLPLASNNILRRLRRRGQPRIPRLCVWALGFNSRLLALLGHCCHCWNEKCSWRRVLLYDYYHFALRFHVVPTSWHRHRFENSTDGIPCQVGASKWASKHIHIHTNTDTRTHSQFIGRFYWQSDPFRRWWWTIKMSQLSYIGNQSYGFYYHLFVLFLLTMNCGIIVNNNLMYFLPKPCFFMLLLFPMRKNNVSTTSLFV